MYFHVQPGGVGQVVSAIFEQWMATQLIKINVEHYGRVLVIH